jgi:hypothetical protein
LKGLLEVIDREGLDDDRHPKLIQTRPQRPNRIDRAAA